MDPKYELILSEYTEYEKTFIEAEKVLRNVLEAIIKECHIHIDNIETRVKTKDSLAGKLDNKGYKYQSIFDLTDIVGARIITFFSDDVDKIASLVTKRFNVDWVNSTDKRKNYKIDQFGYMSLHYIVSIPKSMYSNEEFPQINEFRFEIQLRTTLQHTWATIYHDTGYKSNVEIPTEYLRKLTRLAGLLEMADEEFRNVRDEIEDYRRRVKSIVKNGNLEEVELNVDSFNAYVDNGGFDELNKRLASINHMEIQQVSLHKFIKVLKWMEFRTLKDVDDLVKERSDDAYKLAIYQFEKVPDLDILLSSAALTYLLIALILRLGYSEEVISKLLDTINSPKASNARLAHRYYEYGKTLGLVKEFHEEQ